MRNRNEDEDDSAVYVVDHNADRQGRYVHTCHQECYRLLIVQFEILRRKAFDGASWRNKFLSQQLVTETSHHSLRKICGWNS